MPTALYDERQMFDHNGGRVIQAGEEPKLGDLNFGFVHDTYRKVARLNQTYRFEKYRLGALFVSFQEVVHSERI
jgi:hypothetical protein